MSQRPANFGGTPVVKQNLLSCTCILAGPVDSLALFGAVETNTKYCMSSPRLFDILTYVKEGKSFIHLILSSAI